MKCLLQRLSGDSRVSEEFRIWRITDNNNDNFDIGTSNNNDFSNDSNYVSDAAPIIGAIAGMVVILLIMIVLIIVIILAVM